MSGKTVVKTFETEYEAARYCHMIDDSSDGKGYEDETGKYHVLDYEEIFEEGNNEKIRIHHLEV